MTQAGMTSPLKQWLLYGTVLMLNILFAGLSTVASAQDVPAGVDDTFAMHSLNPVLLLGANGAVVRLDHKQLEVKNRSKATLRVHQAITILDSKGREHGIVGYWYDKFRKPKKLEAQIRDASGKIIRKLKGREIKDYSAISDFSLYEDNRVKVATLEHDVYPYTVEYWYELDFNGYISWPSWKPGSSGLSVERGRFEVIAPSELPVRYFTEGNDLEPAVINEGKETVYRWDATLVQRQMEDLLAALSMEVVPDREEIRVQVAPAEFEIDGSVGDMSSWTNLGNWYYQLNEGRDVLPADKIAEVVRVTDGINDPKEKARKVYELFQASTRYVSVQLGIGGWQTYDAAYVAERGYGDCKALTNYLMAMMDAAGIESHPALIHNNYGSSQVQEEFPNNAFNHVILMVPLPADTLWLEATSQSIPFGRIGAGNEDRYALVIDPEHSTLMSTPASTPEDNARIRKAEVMIHASGSAVAAIEMKYSGNQQDHVIHEIASAPYRDQMEWLHDELEIPSFKVASADFSGVQERRANSTIKANLELPRYAAQTGQRMFINTNLMERDAYVPPEDLNRTRPVFLAYRYVDEDHVAFKLPEGYKIEAMPEDVLLETSFATFNVTNTLDGDALTYRRTLQFREREIEPALYASYRDFLFDVARADRAQVVLVRE